MGMLPVPAGLVACNLINVGPPNVSQPFLERRPDPTTASTTEHWRVLTTHISFWTMPNFVPLTVKNSSTNIFPFNFDTSEHC